MKSWPLSPDDVLLARLQAPPDLHEGAEALAYWRGRRRRLPWYRIGARREAARMAVVWERRVRAALLRQRGVPAPVRVQALKLIGATWLGHYARRYLTRFAVAFAAFTIVFVVLPAALLIDLLLRAF